MAEIDKPANAMSSGLAALVRTRVMAGRRHYVRIRRGDRASECHSFHSQRFRQRAGCPAGSVGDWRLRHDRPRRRRPVEMRHESKTVVEAIFTYHEKRGFEPSAREREILLNL